MKRRVAILISGRGSNMAALIEAAQAEDFPAEIAVVISNRADAVGDDDTPDTLAVRTLEIEHRIYPDALRLLAEGKIRLDGDICKTAGSAASRDVLISPR